jgi:AAA15 family ATPase/GTPase
MGQLFQSRNGHSSLQTCRVLEAATKAEHVAIVVFFLWCTTLPFAIVIQSSLIYHIVYCFFPVFDWKKWTFLLLTKWAGKVYVITQKSLQGFLVFYAQPHTHSRVDQKFKRSIIKAWNICTNRLHKNRAIAGCTNKIKNSLYETTIKGQNSCYTRIKAYHPHEEW